MLFMLEKLRIYTAVFEALTELVAENLLLSIAVQMLYTLLEFLKQLEVAVNVLSESK